VSWQFRILVIGVVSICGWLWFFRGPRTDGGKFVRILCVVNAISWLLLLPCGTRGHPPTIVIVGFILWLINMPLLVAAVIAIIVILKNRQESRIFLATSIVYVAQCGPALASAGDRFGAESLVPTGLIRLQLLRSPAFIESQNETARPLSRSLF